MVCCLWFFVRGLGFGVCGLGFGVEDNGFWVEGMKGTGQMAKRLRSWIVIVGSWVKG